VRVFYLLPLDPFNEERKMIRNLLTIENTVYHVTTKQTHFYLVTSVRINSSVLMDRFENVGSRRSIRKF
jgi:hypothetical protein